MISFSENATKTALLSRAVALAALCLMAVIAASTAAEPRAALPGTVVAPTKLSFPTLVQRTQDAIKASGMLLVAKASASEGAAARGIKISGNAVLMVFRNDYAVRMLEASVPAGIEAPIRLYVTENSDGTATLTYRKPSAVFAPYGSPDLNAMALELDAVFAKIAADAVGG